MKKINSLLFAFVWIAASLLFGLQAHGQNWASVRSMMAGGYTGTNTSVKMIGDQNGHLYFTDGIYGCPVTFGTTTLNSGNAIKFYIAKVDTLDNLIYAVTDLDNLGFGALSASNAIAIDDTGNVYISGTTGSAEIFLAKYNTTGVRVWMTFAHSNANAPYTSSIALDAAGNIYFSAFSFNTMTFHNSDFSNSTGNSMVSGGNGTTYLCKYNNAGFFQWVTPFNAGSSPTRANDLKVNAAGDSWVTGSTDGGTIDFGNSISTTYTTNCHGVFLAKFNNAGLAQWSTKGESGLALSGTLKSSSVFVDASGNSYITGKGEQGIFGTHTNASATAQPFICKFDASGVNQWACFPTAFADPQDIGVTGNGDVFAVGTGFYGATTAMTSVILKIRSDGTFAGRLEANPNGDINKCQDIWIDNQNSIFVGGEFRGIGDFGSTHLTNTASGALSEKGLYIARIDTASTSIPSAIKNISENNEVRLFPNPSTGLSTMYFSGNSINPISMIRINDIAGKEVMNFNDHSNLTSSSNIQLDGRNLDAGIYFVNVYSDNHLVLHKKWVIQ